MPLRSKTAKLAAASAIIALFFFAAFPSAALAQSTGTRQLMERCVDNVLARMARAKVPEAQVGPAVVSHCDGPFAQFWLRPSRVGKPSSAQSKAASAWPASAPPRRPEWHIASGSAGGSKP